METDNAIEIQELKEEILKLNSETLQLKNEVISFKNEVLSLEIKLKEARLICPYECNHVSIEYPQDTFQYHHCYPWTTCGKEGDKVTNEVTNET